MPRRHPHIRGQFDDAETASGSGIGSPVALAYDNIVNKIRENMETGEINRPTLPTGIPVRHQAPVGRGVFIESLQRKFPIFNDKNIERQLDAIDFKYNENLLNSVKANAESQKKPEHDVVPPITDLPGTSGEEASSRRLFGLHSADPEKYYETIDQLNEPPSFVLNEDDFPPL